jgi:acyl-coenzyme A thioesterase PaaI-like protein
MITAGAFVTLPNTAWSRSTMLEASDPGSLTAEAEIVHRGRSTLVIEARVDGDRRRLIGKLVATQLTPVAPTVTAPAARPGR